MAPLEIRLQGNSVIARPAERAVLSVKVSSEGTSQETVSNDVTLTSNNLVKIFRELAPKDEVGNATPDAPITVFSTPSLQTRSWISTTSRNNETVQLPRCFEASSRFKVIFRDFEKLGEISDKLFKMPHTDVTETEYILTDKTQEDLGSESRKAALRDAIQKAQDYAEVVGKNVVAVEITDQGYTAGGRTKQTARRSNYSSSPGVGLSVEPEDVQLKSSITVKFIEG